MSCCVTGSNCQADVSDRAPGRAELLHLSQDLGGALIRTAFAVPDMHCGACIQAVESTLNDLPGVRQARVNLSSKRVVLHWHEREANPAVVLQALDRVGFKAHLIPIRNIGTDRTLKELVLSLGVAGFAAGNIMLLSVSVWSGADGSTRDLFHWLSALIAIPAVAYSGRVFFRPAWRAISVGRLTMDVPISLAIILAVGMSLYETWTHGADAYFDASVGLLFFLLIGRTLDRLMRDRARSTVLGLSRLSPEGAMILDQDDRQSWSPVSEIETGMRLSIAAGDRIPVDAVVLEGCSDIDASIATGESVPIQVSPGTELSAGVLNLTGPLVLRAERPANSSFLAEMIRLLDVAEGGEARYRRLADRAAAIYAPVVHITALVTFLGWLWMTGDWHRATLIAISVLIITCPCALGLAVPIVQVVAASRLFKRGIMIRDGGAMERLAIVDHVAFDKTGTLTVGIPSLKSPETHDRGKLAIAAAIAGVSRHPYAKAVTMAAEALGVDSVRSLKDAREVPGSGVEAWLDGACWRFGRADWAGETTGDTFLEGVVLSRAGRIVDCFSFVDEPRSDAVEATTSLSVKGMSMEILSGDHEQAVARTADQVGLQAYRSRMAPAEKIDHIQRLQAAGRTVLMVGDGLNDTPSLAAADVSMVPATAADIGRQNADFVFMHEGLNAVPFAIETARRARQLIRQNFGLAILYNLIAVPLAVAGYASPLVAALAMSISSLLVTLNALRLADVRPFPSGTSCVGSEPNPTFSQTAEVSP